MKLDGVFLMVKHRLNTPFKEIMLGHIFVDALTVVSGI